MPGTRKSKTKPHKEDEKDVLLRNPLDKTVTRRAALSSAGKLAVGVAAGVVIGAVGGYLAGSSGAQQTPQTVTRVVTQTVTQQVTTTAQTTTGPVGQKVPVTWGIWSWGVELVQDNARIFNQYNPDIDLQVVDYGLDTFFSGLSAAYTAGNPPNIHYSTPDVTYIYQQNGWLIDMEDYFPEIRRYLDDVFPGFRKGLINPDTGKVTGLFYYGGAQAFMYNARHLQEAGIDEPPKTWEDLEEQARLIKQKGVNDDPIGIWYGSWGFVEVGTYCFMLGMTDQEGPFMWDEDLNPIFNDKKSPWFQSLRWQLDMIHKEKLASTKGVLYDEAQAVNAFGSGAHTFFWMPDYDLAFANTPPSKEAGNLRMAVAPGSGRVSTIYRTYQVSRKTLEQGRNTLEATWRVLQFVGGRTKNGTPDFENGEYFVCRRLNNEKGVGPIYISMWEDPKYADIRESVKSWVDPDVKRQVLFKGYDFFNDPRMTTWWSEWWGYWQAGVARPLIHDLILGNRGLSDDDILAVLNRLAEEWNRMKRESKTGK
ncbi:MAG: ABC transporter substrate-binding protein [Nitrososphaerota archaeon]